MNIKKGIFLTCEGPDCSGKSSQLLLLKKFLNNKKIPYLFTREPGGTKISEKLRSLILDKKHSITVNEEILLLMTARLNHINNVIKPNLQSGKLVISDRFADSTFVYQGYVSGYGMKNTIKLHKELINNFLPFKTFLFLITPQEIIKRLKKRKITNKFDKNDIKFHKKVIEGYKKLSKDNNRFINIDSNNPFKDVQLKLQKHIIEIIK